MARVISRGRIMEDDHSCLPVSRHASVTATKNLSVAIMAHPRRRRHLPYLLERLGDVPVILDERNDRWDTGARAMAACDAGSEYHLVVQDDAIICVDFLAGVRELLRHVPFGPVCFYTGKIAPYPYTMRKAIIQAERADARYLSMRGPHWGVAVAVPTCLIADMLKACATIPVDNYDLRMERFFTANDLLCTYTLPSLVNHRVGQANPSLVPDRGSSSGRVARRWIGERSALEYDWRGDLFDVSTVDSNQSTRRFNEMAKTHRVYVRNEKGRAVLATQAPEPPPLELSKRTMADLRRIAKVRGVDITGIRRKADLVEALS